MWGLIAKRVAGKVAKEFSAGRVASKSLESDSERSQCFQGLAKRLINSLRWAMRSQAVSVAGDPSKSLDKRRHLPNHAKVRSTTHRRGKSWKPLTPFGLSTTSISQGPQ